MHQVCNRDAVKKIIGQLVESAPHGNGSATAGTRAGAVARQAGYRREIPLGQAQDFAHPVVLGTARQPVSAALPLQPLHQAVFDQNRHDLLHVFLGNFQPLRNVLHRNIGMVMAVFSKVDHHPQGVAPARGNHHFQTPPVIGSRRRRQPCLRRKEPPPARA